MKQKELSVWLRAVDALAMACLALVCVRTGPRFWRAVTGAASRPELYRPLLRFFWATALPVAAAGAEAWRIFADIGRNMSFTAANARRLRTISRLAMADTLLYAAELTALGCLDMADGTAFLAMLAVIFTGIAVTVITAALSHLTLKAAELKSDSDLTI